MSADQRLEDLAASATKAFGRNGYRGARTADIGRDAGLSAGSVFNYVASKEALFHLVFLRGFGLLDGGTPELPISTPAQGETVALIERELRAVPAPRMRAAMAEDAPDDVECELRGIVAERYESVAGLWPLLAVIERCARDLPELEAFYYRGVRARHFARLTEYLERRADAGLLRATPDPTITARLITETIAWFAWKRHEGRDAHLYDDAVTEATVLQFVSSALVPPTS
ncbi:MAG: TetR/AcrR family transcriptional regulator [Acidimicrobiales bacterium]|nr:TetR/AcrR family transcriptional regulator [Acidimicrobiales bacterium]